MTKCISGSILEGTLPCTIGHLAQALSLMPLSTHNKNLKVSSAHISYLVTLLDGLVRTWLEQQIIICILYDHSIEFRNSISQAKQRERNNKQVIHSLIMSLRLHAMPHMGSSSRGAQGQTTLCRSISIGYRDDIHISVCRVVDHWEIEFVAHHHTTQPLCHRIFHHQQMNIFLSQFLQESNCAPSPPTSSDSDSSSTQQTSLASLSLNQQDPTKEINQIENTKYT